MVAHYGRSGGGGKTVLSWLLRYELSRREQPCFVVRYEGHWPDDLRSELQGWLAPRLNELQLGITPETALNALLEQQRVVVIFDAFDQDNKDDVTAEQLARLRSSSDRLLSENLRVLVTSRPYAVNEHATRVFDKTHWQRCQLELFNEDQQQDYANQVIAYWEEKLQAGERVSALYQQIISERDAVADLLRYPVVQWLIRKIIEDSLENGEPVRAFRNAGDLYWEVCHSLLDRAFNNGREKHTDDIPLLFEAIACFAIEMMLRYRAPRVPQDEIPNVRLAARQRFFDNGKSETQWNRTQTILRETHLTDHCVLKENDDRHLSFPSLKMLEFYTGVYLGKFAQPEIQEQLAPFIGNSQWNVAWQFAIEIVETRDSEGLTAYAPAAWETSLTVLFSQPVNERRPTELMYQAWVVFEQNQDLLSEIREVVLAQYRLQFRMLLLEANDDWEPGESALRVAELVHEDDLPEMVGAALDAKIESLLPELESLSEKRFRSRQDDARFADLEEQFQTLKSLDIYDWCTKLKPEHPAYVLCSDANKPLPDESYADHPLYQREDRLTFMMGSPPDAQHYDSDERPWQMVQVDAIYMACCCVTRAQYRLYDFQWEMEYKQRLDQYSPHADCPATHVTWFDVFCLALWLGEEYQLPSE